MLIFTSRLPSYLKEFVSKFFSKMCCSNRRFYPRHGGGNARISYRNCYRASSSHVYLVQVLKREVSTLYPAAVISNSGPPFVPKRATCGSKTELVRCAETKNRPELGQPLSKLSLGNAPFLRALFFPAERFGYGSLTNLFSTTLSIQANSRGKSLTVSAKRKPVHLFHRHVTIIGRAGASPPSRTTGPRCLYVYIYIYIYIYVFMYPVDPCTRYR